jgi:hypothetical protein
MMAPFFYYLKQKISGIIKGKSIINPWVKAQFEITHSLFTKSIFAA